MEEKLELVIKMDGSTPDPRASISIKGDDLIVADVIKTLNEKYGEDIKHV